LSARQPFSGGVIQSQSRDPFVWDSICLPTIIARAVLYAYFVGSVALCIPAGRAFHSSSQWVHDSLGSCLVHLRYSAYPGSKCLVWTSCHDMSKTLLTGESVFLERDMRVYFTYLVPPEPLSLRAHRTQLQTLAVFTIESYLANYWETYGFILCRGFNAHAIFR